MHGTYKSDCDHGRRVESNYLELWVHRTKRRRGQTSAHSLSQRSHCLSFSCLPELTRISDAFFLINHRIPSQTTHLAPDHHHGQHRLSRKFPTPIRGPTVLLRDLSSSGLSSTQVSALRKGENSWILERNSL